MGSRLSTGGFREGGLGVGALGIWVGYGQLELEGRSRARLKMAGRRKEYFYWAGTEFPLDFSFVPLRSICFRGGRLGEMVQPVKYLP